MAFIPSECTIQEYENQVYSGTNSHRLYLKQGNNVIGDEETDYASPYSSSLTFNNRILDETKSNFSLNNFVSKNVELVLNGIQFDNIEDEIEIRLDTYIESKNVWAKVPLGIFKIQDNPTTDKNKTTYELRDRSIYFDFNYNAQELIENSEHIDSDGNKYVTKLEILLDICEKANVEYVGSQTFIGYDDHIAIYDNTITAREYVSYIAEQSGSIATINRQGKLTFILINNNLTTKTISEDIVESFENGEDFEISKVEYELASDIFEAGDETKDTLYINSANPYISKEEDIERIYNSINGFKINSFSTGKILGNPTIDSYDFIQMTYENVTYKTLAQYEFVFNGVFTSYYDTTITIDAKEINETKNTNATFKKIVKTEIDNVNGSLKMYVQKDDVINSINLSTEGIAIDGQKISLKGKSIDLTGDDITITSNNFNVDSDGNMTCNNALIKGGQVELIDDGTRENASLKINSPRVIYGNLIVGTRVHGTKFELKVKDMTIDDFYIYNPDIWDYDEENSKLIKLSDGTILKLELYSKGNLKYLILSYQNSNFENNYEISIPFINDKIESDVSLEVPNEVDENATITAITNNDIKTSIKLITNEFEKITSYTGNGLEALIVPDYDYNETDLLRIRNIIMGEITPTQQDYERYDLDNNGVINSIDYIKVANYVIYDISSTTPGKVILDTQNLNSSFAIYDGNGNEKIALGIKGLRLNTENIDNYIGDTGWKNLSISKGTAQTGLYKPQYRQIGKQIFLKGSVLQVKTTTDAITTLPTDYRPVSRHTFATTNDSGQINVIRIYENGQIKLFKTSGTISNGITVYFDEISFLID